MSPPAAAMVVVMMVMAGSQLARSRSLSISSMDDHEADERDLAVSESMDEAAARYEADKDSDEWDDEPVRQQLRPRLATVISVRFSPEERETVKEAAGDGGVSRFIRERRETRGFHPGRDLGRSGRWLDGATGQGR